MAPKKKQPVRKEPEKLRLGAGIVHRGDASETVACLDSLLTAGIDPVWIVVIDPTETPGLDEVIEARNDRCKVLGGLDLKGFAACANAALSLLFDAHADAAMIISSDMLAADDIVEKLTPVLEHYPDAAVVGPGIYYIGGETDPPAVLEIDFGAGAIREGEKSFPPNSGWGGIEVAAVMEQSFIIRRSAFQKVGLLDESFNDLFAAAEYCLRARVAGFANFIVPNARVYRARLAGEDSETDEKATYYRVRNGLTIFDRYGSKFPGAGLYRGMNFAARELSKLIGVGRSNRRALLEFREAVSDFFDKKSAAPGAVGKKEKMKARGL